MIKHVHFVTALVCAGALATCSAQPEPMSRQAEAINMPIQRCMNLSGALEAPTEGLWGYTVRFEDIDRLAAAGFDTVRLPVKWSAYAAADAPYTLDQAILLRTEAIIDYALAQGLKIILDVHHYDELNTDPDAHEARLVGIWRQLAEYYQGYPDELIFELINEPHSKMTLARVDALNTRLLAEVRATHPDRWVILGTGQWGTLDGLLKSQPSVDDRTILSVHYYEPFGFTHQGAFFVDPPLPTGQTWGDEADRKSVLKDLGSAAAFANRIGAPVLLGEFGVYEEVPMHARAAWTAHTRRTAESLNMGWCHWGFATTFKTYDQSNEQWLAPIKDALIER